MAAASPREAAASETSFGSLVDGRSNNLDVMRVVFATGVVLFHSFLFTTVPGRDPLVWLTGGTAGLGSESVAAFFIISGLLITASWMHRPDPRSYVINRVLRIYPAFLVVCAFCLLVVGPLGAADVHGYFSALHPLEAVADMLTLGRIQPVAAYEDLPKVAGELNSSLWTIRIEFVCYLLVLALGVLGILRRRLVIAGMFALLLVVRIPIHVASLAGRLPAGARLVDHRDHVELIAFFLAGTTFYLYRERIPRSRVIAAAAGVVWLAAALAHQLWFVTPIVFTYLVFYVGYTPRARFKDFSRHGDLSYGIYLYGWPAQLLVATFLSDHLQPHVFFVVAMVPVVAFAGLSWTMVERPSLSLKRGRRPVVPAPARPAEAA
jgi:peptidoglycan/LPS O-acetylase OafA/YrhL